MKLHWMAFGAALAGLWSAPALAADSGPIKIALIADKTGPLEAYAKQTSAGFAMGLDYATGGTMMVDGHKLIVIEKDSQTKPDVGRNLLNEAYNDDGADIAVGGTSSAVALAMLPVALDNKKIFIVEPAVAEFDHRRQMEPLYLPHRPQFHAGRDVERARHRQARHGRSRRWRRTMPSAATLSPHSRRRSLRPAPSSCSRNTRRRPRPTSPRPIQRIFDALAKEQGRKIIFRQLGRRRQSDVGAQGAWVPNGRASRYRPAATSCRRSPPTRIFPAWKAPRITTMTFPRTR